MWCQIVMEYYVGDFIWSPPRPQARDGFENPAIKVHDELKKKNNTVKAYQWPKKIRDKKGLLYGTAPANKREEPQKVGCLFIASWMFARGGGARSPYSASYIYHFPTPKLFPAPHWRDSFMVIVKIVNSWYNLARIKCQKPVNTMFRVQQSGNLAQCWKKK